jgi:hypothetical protein
MFTTVVANLLLRRVVGNSSILSDSGKTRPRFVARMLLDQEQFQIN